MSFLGDTNVLLRLAVPADPHYALVRSALRRLGERAEQLCYTSQNLVEFWNVCTRPSSARGGFGLSLRETDAAARMVERLGILLEDSAKVHNEWRRLVVAYEVSGVQVYDARLVAAMNVHGIRYLLTFNTTDFKRYPGITVVHPRDVRDDGSFPVGHR